MSMMVNSSRFASAGPALPAGIRGERQVYLNGSSVSFTLPSGSQAGDLCCIVTSHGYDTVMPSGWMPLSYLTQTNWKGGIWHKVLTSGDISTGTVAVNFTGLPYPGEVFGITFIGNLGVRSVAATNDNAGASSRTVTTDAAPVAADYVILVGTCDANVTLSSSSLATLLAVDAQTGAAILAKYDTVATPGAQSATVNFSSAPTGDYQCLIVVTAAAVSTIYTNSGGTGNRSGAITVTATSITAGGGAPQDTVDGSLANSYWWTNATGNGTGWLTFDFGSGASKVIDQFRIYQDTTQSHGTWRFEGSNNNSTWTQCGVDFTLQAAAAIPVPNTTGYRYYRLRHMSGSRSQTPYIREIEFKIA
jgi:hypothetical protein